MFLFWSHSCKRIKSLTPTPSPKERGVISLFFYTKQPTDFRFIAIQNNRLILGLSLKISRLFCG